MIEIEEKAKTEIRKVLQNPDLKNKYYVRLGLSGGACEGKYIFGLDTLTDTDESFEIDDIKIIIDKKHLMHLIGRKVHYKIEDGEGYFAIE
ncbi:MAG: iron-sulfur cluster assembly accessory protein [Cytophagales bacterium]|nr:iron-sulfur cluster assembly accessory protein [Cytophagales bacterium]